MVEQRSQHPNTLARYVEGPTMTEALGSSKYNLIILDFHGTVTDHQLRTINAYHTAAHASLGLHLPTEFYHRALTRPTQNLNSSRTNAHAGTSNKEFIDQEFGHNGPDATRHFYSVFDRQMKNVFIPIPGALKAIRQLIEAGVDIAMLTNGDNRALIQQVLRSWNFNDLADNLFSHHVSGYKKPDPRAVDFVLDDYREKGKLFDTNKVLIVGDRMEDVSVAHDRGMDSVVVMRGPGWEIVPIREPRPTYVTTEIASLIQITAGSYPPLDADKVYVPPVFWRNKDWNPRNEHSEQQVNVT